MKKVLSIAIFFALMNCAFASDDIYGTLNDGVYSNPVMGAKIKFDENWKLLSKVEIDELQKEAAGQSKTFSEVDYSSTKSLLNAETNDKLRRVTIDLTELAFSVQDLPKEYRDQIMAVALSSTKEGLVKMYTEMGGKDVKITQNEVDFLGSKCTEFYLTAMTGLVPSHNRIVILFKGTHLYTIVASSIASDVTEDLLAEFETME